MTNDRVNELERWEGRYSAASGHLFGKRPNAFLARQAPLLKTGWRALAVADGDGRNGVWLAEQGLEVVSLDFSPTAQRRARALAAERGVKLQLELADLLDWRWPEEAFDLVVLIFAQFLAPDERSFVFDRMKRALKPGGLLLIEGYGLGQLVYRTGGPKTPERLYTSAMLEDAFSDFASVETSAYDTELAEGEGHRGMSALVDLVAWK